MGKRAFLTLAAALAAVAFSMSGVALAASPTATPTPKPSTPNVLSNNYYSDAGGSPGGTVHVVNNSGSGLCANIYVTDKDQEMKECCACHMSDKSTRILSVNTDLTDNPANGVATTDGSVAILSSAQATSTTCGDPAKAKGTPQLSGYETHPDAASSLLTEDEFTPLAGTAAAVADLEAECAAIELIGSGAGVCTCGTGD